MLRLFVVKAFLCMIKLALYILDLREFVVVVLLQGFNILDEGLKFSCMVQFNIYELLFKTLFDLTCQRKLVLCTITLSHNLIQTHMRLSPLFFCPTSHHHRTSLNILVLKWIQSTNRFVGILKLLLLNIMLNQCCHVSQCFNFLTCLFSIIC